MRRRTSACDARNQLETSSCSCGLVLARRPSTSGRETGSDARLPSGSTANGTSGSPATEGVAQALQGVVPTRRTSRPARPRIRCLACGQPASSPDAKTLTRSPRGNARLPTLPSAWSSTWPWKPLSEYSSKTPISPKGGTRRRPSESPCCLRKAGSTSSAVYLRAPGSDDPDRGVALVRLGVGGPLLSHGRIRSDCAGSGAKAIVGSRR